ncbi:MFS transporter, partial [Adlercreutzia rubneri]|uniref:MFS transporter n=1 Tax=Adlercreutzia rubneri TaxID=2916441 RepID=UPI0023B1D8AD
ETVASEKLGTYLAVGNSMIALGPAVAPVATGALVGAFGWHSVFVVPLVASALIGLWGLVAVRPSRRGDVQGNFVSLRGELLNRGFVAAALLVVLTMSIYFSLNVIGHHERAQAQPREGRAEVGAFFQIQRAHDVK